MSQLVDLSTDRPADVTRSADPVMESRGWRRLVASVEEASAGRRLGTRAFWLFQLIFWIVSAVALAGTLHVFSRSGVESLIIVGRISTGFLLTCGLYFCYRHRFTRGLSRGVKLMWILGLNVICALLGAAVWQSLVTIGFYEIAMDSPFASFTIARIYSLILWNVAYFGIELILDYHAVGLESAEVREVARAAELKQLQSQLSPHFLFNALNMVMASLEPEHKCREIVKNLADYLRFSLHEARRLEPLSRELDALECYLELQRVRFQDGLHCGISCTPDAMRVPVPPMLVQPLLENAFKYGPLSSPTPLRVEVAAAVVAGWLEIRVSNSGDWMVPGTGDSCGIGLANIRRRLFLLCGEFATLGTEQIADTGGDAWQIVLGFMQPRIKELISTDLIHPAAAAPLMAELIAKRLDDNARQTA